MQPIAALWSTNATVVPVFTATPESILNLATLSISLFVLLVTFRVFKYLQGLKSVRYLPGLRCAFNPFSLPGAMLPASSWNPGLNFQWARRLDLYAAFGKDTLSIVPFLYGMPTFCTANLDVARQVIAGTTHSSWIKPEQLSQALMTWGMNLGAAEGGEVWRRHRRIMGPSFNNETHALVWRESVRLYGEMVAAESWADKDTVDIPVVQTHTFKYALSNITSCGFGLRFAWTEPPYGPDGTMSVQEALRVVSENSMLRVSLHPWLFSLVTRLKKFAHVAKAMRTLETFMNVQVAQRKAEIRQELALGEDAAAARIDVFSRLVLANEESAEKLPLADQELIGNVFLMLFAGHETTGHTLAATLGLLAVHPEEQDIVYENVISVVGNDRDLVYEDYAALDKVLAAFYEALRLFPAGSVLFREALKDTVLVVPGSDGSEGQKHVLEKGTKLMIDMIGIQYNPRYFPDPNVFKPSRWYGLGGPDEAEAYTAFSIGPRTCLGRKFATVESVAFLALLLRDWRVEPVLLPGESAAQWRARVLEAEMVMTLAVRPVPIRLRRRHTGKGGA